MKPLWDGFLVSNPPSPFLFKCFFILFFILFFWFGRFSLCYIQTELQVGMKNGPHPPSQKPRPSVGRGQQDGDSGGWRVFFGLEALHTEREREN